MHFNSKHFTWKVYMECLIWKYSYIAYLKLVVQLCNRIYSLTKKCGIGGDTVWQCRYHVWYRVYRTTSCSRHYFNTMTLEIRTVIDDYITIIGSMPHCASHKIPPKCLEWPVKPLECYLYKLNGFVYKCLDSARIYTFPLLQH